MKLEGSPVREGLVAVIANGLSILAVVPHIKSSVHLPWTLMNSGQVSLKQVWVLKTCITVRTRESLRVHFQIDQDCTWICAMHPSMSDG